MKVHAGFQGTKSMSFAQNGGLVTCWKICRYYLVLPFFPINYCFLSFLLQCLIKIGTKDSPNDCCNIKRMNRGPKDEAGVEVQRKLQVT